MYRVQKLLICCTILIVINSIEKTTAESLYTNTSYCVVILTGYPDLQHKKAFVVRAVTDVISSFSFNLHTNFKHLFCQGDCTDLQKVAGKMIDVHFLTNTMGEDKDRGLIISENYRQIFDEIFGVGSWFKGKKELSCGDHPCEYCVFIEDDLLFSPDAFEYFEKGINLMQKDKTIFAVSAYNDNSYPWVSYNNNFFRRVEQFPGLGFVLSRRNYLKYIAPDWNSQVVWNEWFNQIVRENNLACIQPEISRVMHAHLSSIKVVTNMQMTHSRYDSQKVSVHSPPGIDLSVATAERFDIEIRLHLHHSLPIDNLNDAGFYTEYAKYFLFLVQLVNSTEDIRKVLEDVGLHGRSVGDTVPGIYKDTVFIRPFGAMVLIMSRSSPYMKHYKGTDINVLRYAEPLHICNNQFANVDVLASPSLPDAYKGAVYWLLTTTMTVVAAESCTEACRSRNANCNLAAMWVLNQNCHVIQAVFHRCGVGNCKLYDERGSHEWDDNMISFLPGIDYSYSPVMCKQQKPFYLQCDAAPASWKEQHRLCICSTSL